MTKVVNVAWGLCAPMRYEDHVAPALVDYGVVVLGYEEYTHKRGTGVKVTVSDRQAAYAEYWLCRSGLFSLVGKMHNPKNIEWARKWQDVPVQRGCPASGIPGIMDKIGRMPEPRTRAEAAKRNAGKKAAKQTTRRQTRRTRQARKNDGWISKLFGGWE